MKKSLVALLLVLCLLFSIFAMASCSKPMPNFQMPEGGFDMENEVTIVFYSTMGQTLQDVFNTYLEEFYRLYPNITVDHRQIGNYDDVRDQISTELNAQRQPNIAYCYPDHIALYNVAGAVVTLDQFMDYGQVITRGDGTTEILGLTQEQKDDFVDGYWNEGNGFGDGLMYSLPLSKSTELLFYNATFFEEHDLTVPKTWAEMETLCARIKELDPNCVPLGYDSEANWFITLCEQYGYPYTVLDTTETGTHYLFDDERNYEFVEMIRRWYELGYVTTQEIYGSYTSGLFTETDPEKTRSYMSIGSSGGTAHQAAPSDGNGNYLFEVGIATIPQVDPENPKAISQGPSLCILQNEDPQEVIASWLLMKFLTTNVEFQADFSMASGYVPVIESAKNDPFYQDFLSWANGTDWVTALGATVCLNQADAYFTSPAFNGSTVAREQVGLLLQKCMVGQWGTDPATVREKIKQAFADAKIECEYRS